MQLSILYSVDPQESDDEAQLLEEVIVVDDDNYEDVPVTD